MNINKIKTMAGWMLSALLCLMLLWSGLGKLLQKPESVEMLSRWGLGHQIVILGVGELLSVFLFLIPRTLPIGTLLLSSYLGGAVATHLQHEEVFWIPALALGLLWITAYLRNPALFVKLIPGVKLN